MPEPAVAGELDDVILRPERVAALMTRRKVIAASPGPAVPARTWRVMAAVLAAAALTMEAASFVLLVLNSATTDLSHLGFNGMAIVIVGLTYPIVGWLLASRRPENPIGWLFLAISVALTATLLVGQYEYYGRVVQPGAIPLTGVASWLGVWTWVPGFVLVFVLVLLFPDGSLPSRRWRPVLWLAAVAAVLMAVPGAIAGVIINGLDIALAAPVATNQPLYAIYDIGQTIGTVLMLPVGIAAIGAVVVRFRRAGGIEHQQIKWFAAAGALELGLLLLTTFVTLAYPFDLLAAVAIVPLVPIAMAVAILHYRLYEIDRLISRTIAWTLVTATLAVVFVSLVGALETVLAPFAKGNTLAVAASTLVAFALFQPVRRRVQRAVDRRFDRAWYDGQRAVDAYAERVRNEVDLTVLRASLAATANEAVRPTGSTLWLRPRGH